MGKYHREWFFWFVLEGDDTRNRIYNTVFVVNLTAKKIKLNLRTHIFNANF